MIVTSLSTVSMYDVHRLSYEKSWKIMNRNDPVMSNWNDPVLKLIYENDNVQEKLHGI